MNHILVITHCVHGHKGFYFDCALILLPCKLDKGPWVPIIELALEKGHHQVKARRHDVLTSLSMDVENTFDLIDYTDLINEDYVREKAYSVIFTSSTFPRESLHRSQSNLLGSRRQRHHCCP